MLRLLLILLLLFFAFALHNDMHNVPGEHPNYATPDIIMVLLIPAVWMLLWYPQQWLHKRYDRWWLALFRPLLTLAFFVASVIIYGSR